MRYLKRGIFRRTCSLAMFTKVARLVSVARIVVVASLVIIATVASGGERANAAPASGTDSPAADALWNRAVAVAGRNRNWVARSFTEDRQVFNEDEELKEKTFTRFAVVGAARSALRLRVESSVKNGEDNLTAARAELAKRESRNQDKKDPENPFAPENQSRVTHKALDPTRDLTVNGVRLKAFAFTQTTDRGVWDGVAYLDPRTGIPGRLRSAARIPTLPPPVDEAEKKVKLHSLVVVVDYATSDPAQWRATGMQLNMKISIPIAPFITFDGIVRNRYDFQNYERVPD